MFRKVTYGVLGAAALAASVLLIRSQREVAPAEVLEEVPAGEETPGQVRLERLRELGI